MLQAYNFYDSTYLDRERSRRIGVDSMGNHVYDTVLIQENTLLRRIGKIYNEDRNYTMIAPTNRAFEQAFDYYKNYYKSNGGPTVTMNKDSIQRTRTHLALIRNLIRGGFETLTDTAVASTFTRFGNPRIVRRRRIETSNGDLFIVDSLRFDPYELVPRNGVRREKLHPEDVRPIYPVSLGKTPRPRHFGGYFISPKAPPAAIPTDRPLAHSFTTRHLLHHVPGNTEDSTNWKRKPAGFCQVTKTDTLPVTST